MSTNRTNSNSNTIEWRVIDKTDGRSLGTVFAATRVGALRKSATLRGSLPADFTGVVPVTDTTNTECPQCSRVGRGPLCKSHATVEVVRPQKVDARVERPNAGTARVIVRPAAVEPNLGTARGTARSRRRAALQRPPVPLDVVRANSRPLITPTFRVHGVVTLPFVVDVDARDADTAQRIVADWDAIVAHVAPVTGVRIIVDNATHRVTSVAPKA